MAGLRDDVLHEMRLGLDHLRPFGDDLEEWLSYLSSEQPWLPEEENLKESG
jgi:hypothetical protein